MLNWIRHKLPQPEKLKKTWAFRLLGTNILQPALWNFNRRGLAGGLSLGVFISLTPLLGMHSFLVVLGALVFKVNLPAALFSSFVVCNPLSMVPIFFYEHELGKRLAGLVPDYGNAGDSISLGRNVWRNYEDIWIGAIVFASTATFLSYFLVNFLYRFEIQKKWKKRKKRKV
jgi:uncharacterized protein (DUF2062 family)